MKKQIITLIFSLFTIILYSQNKTIDSLKNILRLKDNSIIQEFSIKIQIAEEYLSVNFDSCKLYLTDLDSSATKINSDSLLTDYYLLAGDYFYRTNNKILKDSFYREVEVLLDKNNNEYARCKLNYRIAESIRYQFPDSSLVYLEKILVSARKNGFKELEGRCYYSKGVANDFKGKYKKAFENYYKAIEFQKKIKDRDNLATTYLSLGITYRGYSLTNAMDKESLRKCKENFDECIKLVTPSENRMLLTQAYTEMGNFYGMKGDFENSLKYLDLAENNARILNSDARLRSIYSSKGNVYAIQKKFKKARSYYKKEEAILIKTGNKENLASLYFNYGYLENQMGNIKESASNFKQALNLAKREGNSLMQEGILGNLSLLYSSNNNYKEAYQFQKQRQSLRDSLRNEKNSKLIKELEVKYESEKLKQEKLIIQGEQKITELNNKKLLFGLFVFLILTPFIIWFAYRENKRKRNETLLNEQLTKKNKEVEQANASLSQKNQEILHRAKNHLTMLSVFMKQEARRVDDPKAKSALLETENRLQAISLIDRKLNSNQGVEIAIKEYLEELTTYIKQTFPENGKALTLKTNLASIMVNPEEAVWIGLIINELMTNSYKYAFKNTTNPEIEISLNQEENNKLKMNYRDNGSGIVQPINEQYTKSFGQQLIHNFTEQMNGQLDIFNNKGLIYDFQFNLLTIK